MCPLFVICLIINALLLGSEGFCTEQVRFSAHLSQLHAFATVMYSLYAGRWPRHFSIAVQSFHLPLVRRRSLLWCPSLSLRHDPCTVHGSVGPKWVIPWIESRFFPFPCIESIFDNADIVALLLLVSERPPILILMFFHWFDFYSIFLLVYQPRFRSIHWTIQTLDTSSHRLSLLPLPLPLFTTYLTWSSWSHP